MWSFRVHPQILLLKGTCRTTVTIKVISFRAIMTLLLRPLIYAQMSQNILMVHIEYIQTIPALMYHLETMIPDFMGVIHSNMLVDKLLDILSSEEALQIIMSKLKGTQILALLGNLINLFHAEPEGSSTIMCYPKFTVADLDYSSNWSLTIPCFSVRMFEFVAQNSNGHWI